MFLKTLLFLLITFIVPNNIYCCNDRCGLPQTKCCLEDIQCIQEQERGFRKWYQSKEALNFLIENINPYSIDKIEVPLDCKRVDLINVTIYGVSDTYLKIYNIIINKDIYKFNATFTHDLCLHADGSVLVDLLTGKEVIDDCPLQIDFTNVTTWNTMDAVKVNRCDGKAYLKTFKYTSLIEGGTGVIKTGLKRVQENLNQVEKADFKKVLPNVVGNLCSRVIYNNYEILTASADLDKLFE